MNDMVLQKKIVDLAPIVLFTYNRLEHTRKTIEALQNNLCAKESHLYIYSDAPKNEAAKEKVFAVRNFLRTVGGFKEITIIMRKENWGLARNIIDGVTEIVNRHERVIVLEDDLITSKYFLQYMNDALELYKDEKRVMEISGYLYPIEGDGVSDTFFLNIGECWGWGTWHDRWRYFERKPECLLETYKPQQIFDFNYYGSINLWQQVIDNCEGKLYTWAVFWLEAIFRHRGLVLYPKYSMVQNIGLDASGEHCGVTDVFDGTLNECEVVNFTTVFSESKEAKRQVISFLKEIYSKEIAFLSFCKNYKIIFFYGAGYCGQITKRYAEMKGILLQGFIISDHERSTLEQQIKAVEMPTYCLSDIKVSAEETGIILTLDEQYHKEIVQKLVEKGVRKENVFFGGMRLAAELKAYLEKESLAEERRK